MTWGLSSDLSPDLKIRIRVRAADKENVSRDKNQFPFYIKYWRWCQSRSRLFIDRLVELAFLRMREQQNHSWRSSCLLSHSLLNKSLRWNHKCDPNLSYSCWASMLKHTHTQREKERQALYPFWIFSFNSHPMGHTKSSLLLPDSESKVGQKSHWTQTLAIKHLLRGTLGHEIKSKDLSDQVRWN